MNTDIMPYRRMGDSGTNCRKVKNKGFLNTLLSKSNIILIPAAFLLGRASLVQGLMPFGISLYASTIGLKVNRALVAAFVILGMLAGGAKEQIYISVAAMFLFNALNIPFRNTKGRLNLRYATIAFISVLIPELLTAYLQGFLLYDLLKALLHGLIVFTLIFIFRNVVSVVDNTKKNLSLSSEHIISIAITAALALSGLAGLQFFGFTIKNVLCILIILLFSFKCGPGVGSAIGVTIGLIVSMSTTTTPLIIGSYAFCGLLSGVLRNLGKVGSSLGFVMGNAVLTLYLNGSTEVLIYLKEIVFAITIFMLLPQKLIATIVDTFNGSMDSSIDKKSYSARIKEMTVDKLNKFSRTFKELSTTFREISETKISTDKQDLSTLFDRVADKVCKNCSLCLHCWDRNFYSTYQVMFKIVEKLDAKGRVLESDLPDYFMDRCERINEFVEAVNNIYELFKVDMIWKSKVGESRGLVSQQLDGLSKVISNLASEIDLDVHFKGDIEDNILMKLNKSGINTSDVIVFENKWGKYEIDIFHKSCGGRRICASTIEKLVSSIVGRKMTKENSDCYKRPKGNLCTLKLVEEEKFSIMSGVARLAKHNNMVSGDCYTFLNNGDGKYIAALSDGMGSGQRAATQSKATISLLEQFMESGFDKYTAVKLINSILVLKSSDDSFATIDLSVIDLYSGEVEFVKVGAVPTFIKRGNKVETVKSVSIPAGILSNIELELVHKQLDSGDFVIMMSDGITDSFQNIDEDSKSLLNIIQDIDSSNPQEIADHILSAAYENCCGRPIDDMMVVVAKVWKRVL